MASATRSAGASSSVTTRARRTCACACLRSLSSITSSTPCAALAVPKRSAGRAGEIPPCGVFGLQLPLSRRETRLRGPGAQAGGEGQGALVAALGAEHANQLGEHRVALEALDAGLGAPARGLLDAVVAIGQGGDLR